MRAPCSPASALSEYLPRKVQLFLRRELLVELLGLRFVHKVALRGGVFAGDTVEIAGDQFAAEEEGGILALGQTVVADAAPQ